MISKNLNMIQGITQWCKEQRSCKRTTRPVKSKNFLEQRYFKNKEDCENKGIEDDRKLYISCLDGGLIYLKDTELDEFLTQLERNGKNTVHFSVCLRVITFGSR